MTKRFKPTWEELKLNNVLALFGTNHVLTIPRLQGFLKYLSAIGVHYEVPFSLIGKTFITQEEYDTIKVSSLECCSYTSGKDDQIDPIIIQKFKSSK